MRCSEAKAGLGSKALERGGAGAWAPGVTGGRGGLHGARSCDTVSDSAASCLGRDSVLGSLGCGTVLRATAASSPSSSTSH